MPFASLWLTRSMAIHGARSHAQEDRRSTSQLFSLTRLQPPAEMRRTCFDAWRQYIHGIDMEPPSSPAPALVVDASRGPSKLVRLDAEQRKEMQHELLRCGRRACAHTRHRGTWHIYNMGSWR